MVAEIKKEKIPIYTIIEIRNAVNSLVNVKFSFDVMENLTCSNSITCRENRFPIKRVSIDTFNYLGSNKKWVLSILYPILGVLAPCSNVSKVFNGIDIPILRNHPYLSQLIPRLHFFHANPIFSKCPSTFAANAATRSASSGIGAA